MSKIIRIFPTAQLFFDSFNKFLPAMSRKLFVRLSSFVSFSSQEFHFFLAKKGNSWPTWTFLPLLALLLYYTANIFNRFWDTKKNCLVNTFAVHFFLTTVFDPAALPLLSACPNVSTTPLVQWGFRQCLPFSWTTLRGKHCHHPVMGVVDTFGH